MELIEDTQYALGLLNVNNERQLNSNNSITGAKLLNGVKKTNSNEDILQYSKTIDSNGEPCVMYYGTRSDFTTFHMHKRRYREQNTFRLQHYPQRLRLR